jgi:hypothetical protein
MVNSKRVLPDLPRGEADCASEEAALSLLRSGASAAEPRFQDNAQERGPLRQGVYRLESLLSKTSDGVSRTIRATILEDGQ